MQIQLPTLKYKPFKMSFEKPMKTAKDTEAVSMISAQTSLELNHQLYQYVTGDFLGAISRIFVNTEGLQIVVNQLSGIIAQQQAQMDSQNRRIEQLEARANMPPQVTVNVPQLQPVFNVTSPSITNEIVMPEKKEKKIVFQYDGNKNIISAEPVPE